MVDEGAVTMPRKRSIIGAIDCDGGCESPAEMVIFNLDGTEIESWCRPCLVATILSTMRDAFEAEQAEAANAERSETLAGD